MPLWPVSLGVKSCLPCCYDAGFVKIRKRRDLPPGAYSTDISKCFWTANANRIPAPTSFPPQEQFPPITPIIIVSLVMAMELRVFINNCVTFHKHDRRQLSYSPLPHVTESEIVTFNETIYPPCLLNLPLSYPCQLRIRRVMT